MRLGYYQHLFHTQTGPEDPEMTQMKEDILEGRYLNFAIHNAKQIGCLPGIICPLAELRQRTQTN